MPPPRNGQAPHERAGEKGKEEKKRRVRAGQVRRWVPGMAATVVALSGSPARDLDLGPAGCRTVDVIGICHLDNFLYLLIYWYSPGRAGLRHLAALGIRNLAALRAGFRQEQQGQLFVRKNVYRAAASGVFHSTSCPGRRLSLRSDSPRKFYWLPLLTFIDLNKIKSKSVLLCCGMASLYLDVVVLMLLF